MNLLLLGSGGRECALAWKLAQSPKPCKLWIAPGNAGTELYGTNVPVSETDFEGIKRLVLENDIEMLVVGPEVPLAKGITDYFKNDGLLGHVKVIGPSQQGAMLESSKDFAKAFMMRHGIPTARYMTFTASNIEQGYAFLDSLKPPYVLKADGLAAGKGVVIHDDLTDAKATLHDMLANERFGEASQRVVVEEFLQGIELSVFVLTDGKNYVILPNAKDYKRIGEGDTGLNTGGMGSVSPVPFADATFMQKVEERIITPTISGIQKEAIDYCGFIFFGLINCQGNPYVIEYNVRLGDPETQAILLRIENDLADMFDLTTSNRITEIEMQINSHSAVSVVLVSDGYPGSYKKGHTISGFFKESGIELFHAGTKRESSGQVITNGGRVIAVTGLGDTLVSAREKAYQAAGKIRFEGVYYRRDIGKDLLSSS